jgi:glutaredoxin 3
MVDHKQVDLYVSRRCWHCWRTKRLLAHHAFRFEVIEVSDDAPLRSWLSAFTGRTTLPYVFVDHRPVGGFEEIRVLERLGQLDHLVRDEV